MRREVEVTHYENGVADAVRRTAWVTVHDGELSIEFGPPFDSVWIAGEALATVVKALAP